MKDISYHNYTEKEALEYTSNIINFGVTLIVYAALNEVLNGYILIRQSKYYKNVIKQRANRSLALRNRKVEQLKSMVKTRKYAESFWDAIIDVCEDDVANLRKEIKVILDNALIEDSDLYAQAETTRVMLEAAKIHYEEVIKECTTKFIMKNAEEMKKLNLFDAFHEFYIDGIFREWNIICDELYKNKHTTIELTDDNTLGAFNVMADKFAKGLYIDQCLKAASADYPEFADVKITLNH